MREKNRMIDTRGMTHTKMNIEYEEGYTHSNSRKNIREGK
jgi:hypothetical protein